MHILEHAAIHRKTSYDFLSMLQVICLLAIIESNSEPVVVPFGGEKTSDFSVHAAATVDPFTTFGPT